MAYTLKKQILWLIKVNFRKLKNIYISNISKNKKINRIMAKHITKYLPNLTVFIKKNVCLRVLLVWSVL